VEDINITSYALNTLVERNVSYGDTHLVDNGTNTALISGNLNITSSGFVGVGTASPEAKLQVVAADGSPISGNLLHLNQGFLGGTGYDYARLSMGVGSDGNQKHAQLVAGSALGGTNNAPGFLDFYTSDANNVLQNRIRIDQKGALGIGTISPGYKVDIVSPVTGGMDGVQITAPNFPGLNLVATNATASWGSILINKLAGATQGYSTNSLANALLLRGSNSVQLAPGDSVSVTALAGGAVGIGTASPGAKLEVTGGDIKVTDMAKGIILTNAAGTVTKRVRLNDAGNGLIFENP
jgi:hypothetical protein